MSLGPVNCSCNPLTAWIRHFSNIGLAALPPTRFFGLRRSVLRMAGVKIHKTASFCGRGWIYGRGMLSIGEDSWISPGAILHTHPNASIEIGARCDVGPSVEIHPGSHQIGASDHRAGVGTAASVKIENGCWIGARTLILGGVTIGSGAIVAAGSVVVGDIPPNVLAAGVPAKVKRHLL